MKKLVFDEAPPPPKVFCLRSPSPCLRLPPSLPWVSTDSVRQIPKNTFSGTLELVHVDEEELARQMTILEFDTYRRIKPAELLNQAWLKKRYKYRAKNVLTLISRFNAISTFNPLVARTLS